MALRPSDFNCRPSGTEVFRHSETSFPRGARNVGAVNSTPRHKLPCREVWGDAGGLNEGVEAPWGFRCWSMRDRSRHIPASSRCGSVGYLKNERRPTRQ